MIMRKREDTVSTPSELLTKIYNMLRSAYSCVGGSTPDSSRQLTKNAEAIGDLVEKLDISLLKKLFSDAEKYTEHFEKLKKLEELSEEIVSAERNRIKKARFILGVAKKVRNKIKRIELKSLRKGRKEMSEGKREANSAAVKMQRAAKMTGAKR